MRVHIVQKGDTLWKIAKQYAIGFEELKRLNAHLANPDYIVPGMEIYLPATAGKKEVNQVVKEQPKPVKEMPVPTKPTPAPAPTPVPAPAQPAQKPLWQGNLYFQQPMPTPQPVPMPMPMPNWQTHVHVQPTMEQHMPAPPQQMMPQQMMPPQIQPQPIYIQQPQQQPIFIEQPMPMMPQFMPQMQQMPQMMPVHPCPHCHKMPVEEPMWLQPAKQEESPEKDMMCDDHDQQVRQYYEEIHQMMCMPQPCCHPQMMPYNPFPMSQMMPHNQRSWHM